MVAIILMAIVGVFAVALAIAALRVVSEIALRVAAVATIILLAAIIGGMIASAYGYDGGLSGLAVAAVTIFPALMVVWSWRGSIADKLEWRDAKPVPLSSQRAVPTKPIEEALALEDAEALNVAWEDAQELAPRDALGEDREACARFLAVFEASADCDPAAVDLATLIRRQMPELVSETRAVVDRADRDERREVIAAMVADIRQVGDEARAALAAQHVAARERLGIRRTLFTARVQKRIEVGVRHIGKSPPPRAVPRLLAQSLHSSRGLVTSDGFVLRRPAGRNYSPLLLACRLLRKRLR